MNASAEFVIAIINAFEASKRLADRAVEQVRDDQLHVALDENTNSIAIVMKHVGKGPPAQEETARRNCRT